MIIKRAEGLEDDSVCVRPTKKQLYEIKQWFKKYGKDIS